MYTVQHIAIHFEYETNLLRPSHGFDYLLYVPGIENETEFVVSLTSIFFSNNSSKSELTTCLGTVLKKKMNLIS